MDYKYKYVNPSQKKPHTTQGRVVDPDKWCTGPDPEKRDHYYSFLKHRSQAKHRKDEYEITYDEWCKLWPIDLWRKRGRGADDLCLSRIDYDLPWSLINCHVVTRREHLKRNHEFRRNGR